MSLWLRLASGSGRQAVARQLLVIAGIAVATALLLLAAGIATITQQDTGTAGSSFCEGLADGTVRCVDSPGTVGPIDNDYLVQPGLRRGVVIGFVLCTVPLLVFVSVASRVAARRRDERLAALRLAGATQQQVRRLAVLDSLVGGCVGAVLGTLVYAVAREVLLRAGSTSVADIARATTPPPLLGVAVVLVLLGALAAGGAYSLRRVIVGPLDVVRHQAPYRPRPWALPVLVVTLAALSLGFLALDSAGPVAFAFGLVALVVIMLTLAVSGAWITAATGRVLAARASSPALLLAARRMEDEPRAHARALSSVLLVTFSATVTLGTLSDFLATYDSNDVGGLDDFARQGFQLTAVGIGFSLLIACTGLLVTTVEGLAERRRTLARVHAAGVPIRTLRRAVLLGVCLPAVPATALAMLSGLVLSCAVYTPSVVFGEVGAWPLAVPIAPVLVATAITALSLPGLRGLTSPEVLRTP